MANRITKDLWQLEIPLLGNPLKNLNSYLILGERNLLIDTGFRQEPCRVAMEQQLAELKVDLERTDIFLTHLHSDHTGLAPELIRPGCRMYIGRTDGIRMTKTQDSDFWRTQYSTYVREGFSEEEMAALWDSNPAKNAGPEHGGEYQFLEDGDTLSYGSHTLECILTPGHTPGHMCLYDRKNRWFFSGDHVLFHITPNICRWMGVEDSLGDYLQSLQKIRNLPVDLLLPAHRAETGNLSERVDFLTEHHMQRLEDAMRVVRREPGLNAYQIAGRMTWSIRSRNWQDFPLTQKYFAVGEALSHLDYLERRGRIIRQEEHGKLVYIPAAGGAI